MGFCILSSDILDILGAAAGSRDTERMSASRSARAMKMLVDKSQGRLAMPVASSESVQGLSFKTQEEQLVQTGAVATQIPRVFLITALQCGHVTLHTCRGAAVTESVLLRLFSFIFDVQCTVIQVILIYRS